MAKLPSQTVGHAAAGRRPSVAPMTTTPVRPSPAELESSLEAYFRETVRRRLGGMVIKLAPTVKGVPDRLVLLPMGGIKLVELKAVTGSLSAIQRLRHDRILELGTPVVTLSGRADVDRWVRQQFPDNATITRDMKAGRSPRGLAPAKVLTTHADRATK